MVRLPNQRGLTVSVDVLSGGGGAGTALGRVGRCAEADVAIKVAKLMTRLRVRRDGNFIVLLKL